MKRIKHTFILMILTSFTLIGCTSNDSKAPLSNEISIPNSFSSNVTSNSDTIGLLDQNALIINPISDKMVGDEPFQLSTTGGSGSGTVSYMLTSGTAASVTNDGMVSIISDGEVRIQALKAGDETYKSVTSAVLTISFNLTDYEIGYVLNGGENYFSNPTSYTYLTPTITLKDPTRIGYDFDKWQEGNTIPQYSKGNKIFTAQWTAKTYAITFDKQDGTGGSNNVIATYDEPMPFAIAPSLMGYRFLGYYSAKIGGTKYYNSDMSSANNWNLDKDATLYAKFELATQGLVFMNVSGVNDECYVSSFTGEATEIIIPSVYEGKKVTSIGDSAFMDKEIASIEIPASITKIGKSSFKFCRQLSVVSFEKDSKLNLIDDYAFDQSALASISIPSRVITIGSYAFRGCVSLTSVLFEEDSQLNDIKMWAFSEAPITEFLFPSTVTKVGSSAFSDTLLTNIVIPQSMTSIGSFSFVRTNIKSLTIPAHVIHIGEFAFAYSYDLTSVTVLGAATTSDAFIFKVCEKLTAIYVPASSLTFYQNATNWKEYSSIIKKIS